MLLRRALPAARQSLAHPFPIYEMGSRVFCVSGRNHDGERKIAPNGRVRMPEPNFRRMRLGFLSMRSCYTNRKTKVRKGNFHQRCASAFVIKRASIVNIYDTPGPA